MLIFKRRRYSQPQSAALVDRSNPLAARLVFDTLPYSKLRDNVSGVVPGYTVGSIGQATGVMGLAATFASAVLGYGNRELFSGAQATFQIIDQPTSLSQVAGIINKRTTGTSNNSFSIGYNYSGGTRLTVEVGNTGGTGTGIVYQFPLASFTTAAPNNLVIVIDGQAGAGLKAKLYRNGVLISPATFVSDTAFTIFPVTSAPIELGRVNSTTNYYSGQIFLTRAWDRALSEGEIQQITANPWQAYRSPAPRYVPAPTTGAPYTLTCAAGSFSLTGTNTGLLAARKLAAAQASYVLTGQAATLRTDRRLAAAVGTFGITGTATTLRAARMLTASSGAFSLTGQETALRAARRLSAAAASFALTGTDTGLIYTPAGQVLIAAVGSFSLTGNATGLRATRRLASAVGSFAILGNDAGLVIGRRLSAAAGSYVLTGSAVNFAQARRLAAEAGSFTLTGTAVTLTYSGATSPTISTYMRFVVSAEFRNYSLAADSRTYNIATEDRLYSVAGEARNYTVN